MMFGLFGRERSADKEKETDSKEQREQRDKMLGLENVSMIKQNIY